MEFCLTVYELTRGRVTLLLFTFFGLVCAALSRAAFPALSIVVATAIVGVGQDDGLLMVATAGSAGTGRSSGCRSMYSDIWGCILP